MLCVVMSWCCHFLRIGQCKRHGNRCDLADNIAQLHIAGTPCTAYSTMGLLDGEDAMSFAHFLCWAGLRAKLQEPLIIQECTAGFPQDVFVSLLPMYDWMAEVVSPDSFGWPVRRPRQWVVSLVCSGWFLCWLYCVCFWI